VVSSAELEADPHGVFRRWRAEVPVIEREDGACIVLRAADVDQLLTDPRTRQIEGADYARMRGVPPGPLFELLAGSLLMSNGQAHRRRRAPLSRTLAFRAVESLRPHVRSLADGLIDQFEADGEAELVGQFAAPLPPLVVSHLLGAPPDDAPAFANWVYQVTPAFAPMRLGEDMGQMVAGAARLADYVELRLAHAAKAQEARAGLLNDVLAATLDGELSVAEATSQLGGLIIGGSDTTRAAMAVQVGLLLAHGAPWSSMASDPELARAAVAEALRYEPSVASVPRFSLEEIEFDGGVIPAGRLVSLSTLSAMRDPARFADPDTFSIDRRDHSRWHMAFGGGAHRCIGEALGRIELEEGLMALSRRLPGLQLAGPPPVLRGFGGIRRISELWVKW
jgi:cytochrome P450